MRMMDLVWDWSTDAEKEAKEAFDTACKLDIAFFDTGTRTADKLWIGVRLMIHHDSVGVHFSRNVRKRRVRA